MAPSKESNQSKLLVMVGPDDYISDSTGFVFVNLRHPKTSEPALFSFKDSKESKDVREIITLNQEFGAWFIGDVIEEDGRLHIATPVDPVLLVLPYLRASKRPVPLDHLLMEDESQYPELVNRLVPVITLKGLDPVAKSLGSPDLNVWQYDEKKAMTYLAKKVNRVANEISTSGTPTDDDIRTSWQILSDYLEPEVSTQLAKHLNIKEEQVKKPEPLAKATTLTGSRSLPTGSKEGARPLEDYSDESPEPKSKVAKMAPPSTKQKALAKSAAGSKSIMSFFGKK